MNLFFSHLVSVLALSCVFQETVAKPPHEDRVVPVHPKDLLEPGEGPGSEKIINGTEAPIDTYLWFASLYVDGDFLNCGGFLVAPDIVMTPAHCVEGYDMITVVVGNYDANDPNNGGQYKEVFDSTELFVHPEWGDVPFDKDYGLIKLPSPSAISPVLIDGYDEQSEDLTASDKLKTIGFGRTEDGVMSTYLKETVLGYVPNDQCVDPYTWWSEEFITENMICAFEPNTNICYGDSGGPLFDDDTGVVFGITSWVITGCDSISLAPSGFARISSEYKWIQTTICTESAFQNSLDLCNETSPPTVSPSPTTPQPTKEVCEADEIEFDLTATSDYYYGETLWELIQTCDASIVFYDSNPFSSVAETVTKRACLDPTKGYSFTIYDTYGDGLSVAPVGSYEIYLDGTLYASGGGNFGFNDTTTIFSCAEGPCAEDEEEFLLSAISDNYYSETSWKLVQDCDMSTVFNNSNPFTGVGQNVNETACLDPTKGYSFTIYDSYGDGLSVDPVGSYQIYLDNSLYFSGGGNFGYSETTTMYSCPPTQAPSGSFCSDPPFKFLMKKPNGKKDWKTCDWVADNVEDRCDRAKVRKTCPLACDSCDVCDDSPYQFKIKRNGIMKKKDCKWVKDKAFFRCGLDGVAEACRKTCGLC